MLDILTACAALATTVGVFLVAYQLRDTRRQERTAFEDDLVSEYRSIVATLPVEAFFTNPPTLGDAPDHRNAFFRYFDLTNQQAFLYSHGRVSDETWHHWREGINDNLRLLPMFREAWDDIVPRVPSNSWEDLRKIAQAQGLAGYSDTK